MSISMKESKRFNYQRCLLVIRVTQLSPKVNEFNEDQWETREALQTFRMKLICSHPLVSAVADDSTCWGL